MLWIILALVIGGAVLLRFGAAAARRRPAGTARLWPEATVSVTIDDHGVRVAAPGQPVQLVAWVDLVRVDIQTNDSGPWGADVWWVLRGNEGECHIPQGATGEAALLPRLQQLPAFDNQALIAAMRSTSNQVFTLWRRPPVDESHGSPAVSA